MTMIEHKPALYTICRMWVKAHGLSLPEDLLNITINDIAEELRTNGSTMTDAQVCDLLEVKLSEAAQTLVPTIVEPIPTSRRIKQIA